MQHGPPGAGAAGAPGWGGRHVVVHHLLGESGNGAGEKAEGRGLLKEGAAGGGQSGGLRTR